MHTAILYNDKGKSLGKKYYSYRKVSVLPNTVDINGSEYYKLALGDDYNEAYIKASNIDGTKRTLKRNAYAVPITLYLERVESSPHMVAHTSSGTASATTR